MQRMAPLADRALLVRVARCTGTLTVQEIARLVDQDAAWVREQLATHGGEWWEDAVPADDVFCVLLDHFPQSEIERALGEDVTLLPDVVRIEALTISLPTFLIRALEAQAREAAARGDQLTASVELYVTEQLLGLIDEAVVERATPGASFALIFPHHLDDPAD